MNTLESLGKLRDFFETHEWCQGDLSKYDEDTDTRSWCLVGGVATCGLRPYEVIGALNKALEPAYQHSLSWWNDHVAKTKDDVLALIDRAIGMEEKKPSDGEAEELLKLELVEASEEAAAEKAARGGYS